MSAPITVIDSRTWIDAVVYGSIEETAIVNAFDYGFVAGCSRLWEEVEWVLIRKFRLPVDVVADTVGFYRVPINAKVIAGWSNLFQHSGPKRATLRPGVPKWQQIVCPPASFERNCTSPVPRRIEIVFTKWARRNLRKRHWRAQSSIGALAATPRTSSRIPLQCIDGEPTAQ